MNLAKPFYPKIRVGPEMAFDRIAADVLHIEPGMLSCDRGKDGWEWDAIGCPGPLVPSPEGLARLSEAFSAQHLMTLEIIDRQVPTSEDFTPEMADRQAIGTTLDKNLLRSHSKPNRVYAGANDVLSWYWNINAGRAASVAQMPREDQLV